MILFALGYVLRMSECTLGFPLLSPHSCTPYLSHCNLKLFFVIFNKVGHLSPEPGQQRLWELHWHMEGYSTWGTLGTMTAATSPRLSVALSDKGRWLVELNQKMQLSGGQRPT